MGNGTSNKRYQQRAAQFHVIGWGSGPRCDWQGGSDGELAGRPVQRERPYQALYGEADKKWEIVYPWYPGLEQAAEANRLHNQSWD